MKRTALLLIAALGLASCTPRYIDNTRIEDTTENREIIKVVEQYRRAVEDKDVQRILDLVSDEYFEDPGTPDNPADDYDKAGLKARLEEAFSKVREQKLAVDVRKIDIDEDTATAKVDYRFDYRYRLDLPSSQGEWREETDLNRMTMQLQNDQWKITSGL